MLLCNRWCGANHRVGLRNSRAELYPNNNILNCSKLMGGLLQKIEQEWCRFVAGDATINLVLKVHRNQSATCNHTATVIVGVVNGYSGSAEISLCLRLERVWTLIQCWFGWLLQKDQYWWALMSSQATIKTTINPYLEFFSYLRKGRKRSEDLRHRTCKKGQGICNNQPMQINLNITQLLSFCYVILNATKNYISI